ncbi:MAG: adenylyl-sulfate kinase [Deltaproteobacteria bacterium]|nr:adenylyl-sulfate kinase [Deltaproteobacteria bacterium]MCB9785650.1 adenylyl-sulfate kinase [Deltaproteobacteria bacterium]
MSGDGTVVWLTGRPAAGKTTLAAALVERLRGRGVEVRWLDSDALRRELTPEPTYSPEERDAFYRRLAELAVDAAREGAVAVISATAHRRRWRDEAREAAPRFIEVWVRADDEVLRARDPKGLYARAAEGAVEGLPGVDVAFEAPAAAEVEIATDQESVTSAVSRILALLLAE